MRKNQYEEALFRVEDDRFELDMAIETNASALRAMQRLVAELEELQDRPAERERWAPAPGALTAIHYRAASRIYGDHGFQVLHQPRWPGPCPHTTVGPCSRSCVIPRAVRDGCGCPGLHMHEVLVW